MCLNLAVLGRFTHREFVVAPVSTVTVVKYNLHFIHPKLNNLMAAAAVAAAVAAAKLA